MTQYGPATLGKRLKILEAGDFLITEAETLPLTSFRTHAHELASITFIIKGSCVETISSRAYDCSPLSAIIKPAGELHSNRYGKAGARCLIVEVKPERLQKLRMFTRMLDSALHLRETTLGAFALRIYKEFKIGDTASLLSLEGLILDLLGHTTRLSLKASPPSPPAWLLSARDLCHEQFNRPLGLQLMAERIGVHPAHLSRSFRKYFQCTLGEYVRHLRLNYAARELAESRKSLAEIAYRAGFYDQSHFTHAFKLHTGMTPTQYRRATKGCWSARG